MGKNEKRVTRSPNTKRTKRAPLWLRIVLMLILLLVVCFAFYMNNLNIIERLNQ